MGARIYPDRQQPKQEKQAKNEFFDTIKKCFGLDQLRIFVGWL